MTVTYGFYDSLAGDRKYNAEQMSRLFEGIITNGVFQSIGGYLLVLPNTGMTVKVSSGRAWFNLTWTHNDADLPLTLDPSEVALNRIDSIILEVNKNLDVRANSIKILKGTPASSPVAPTLANTSLLKQYALANIYVGMGVTSIISANITNKIGSAETPFITGILETIDAATLLSQFEAQFNAWFNNLVNQLSGSQVTNLQNQIDQHTYKLNSFENYTIVPTIDSGNLTVAIKDLAGNNLTATNFAKFKIGDANFTLSSSLSVTKNAATDWCDLGSFELAGNDVDVFVYIINETGAAAGLKVGFSRIPYAITMGDFTNANFSEKYIAGNWTNFNSTDKVANIGRFRARLSGNPSFVWSIPNPLVVNKPIYETELLNMLSVVGGYTTKPAGSYYYKLTGKSCRYILAESGFSTSGLAAQKTYSLPFTSANKSPALSFAGVAPFPMDNGIYQPAAGVKIENNTKIATVYKSALANWIASANNCNVNTFVIDFDIA
jgi:hypothetical protein